LAFLPHRRQHFLGDEEWSAAGDVQRGIQDLDRDVFEQFLLGRKITTFEVPRIINQNVRIAGFAADRGERRRDRVLRDEIQLDDHAFAALLADGRRQSRCIGLVAGRQHSEETLLRELLRHRAADAPAHADRQFAVIHWVAMRQQGIAALSLPFGGGADHHSDLLALRVRFHSETFLFCVRPWAGGDDVPPRGSGSYGILGP
jgi:hypothetical protein